MELLTTFPKQVHPYCRTWINQPRAKGVRQMKERFCYYNAARLALRRNDWTYVEGTATHASFGYMAIEHAWIVDATGRVIDPTWKYDPARLYVGVPFLESWLWRAGNVNRGWTATLWLTAELGVEDVNTQLLASFDSK